MGKALDLTNQKFGRLTAIEPTSIRKNNSIVWKCVCECGNYIEVDASSLRRLKTKSCGCLKKEKDKQPKGNVIDLTGQKFGHLLVIKRDSSDARGEAKWLCECDCSQRTQLSVLGSNLRKGHTQSCGCDRRSHGELAVAQLLKKNNLSFEQEKIMFKYSSGTNAKFDFFVENKYLIEYDGETHYSANLHGWHTPVQLQAQQERDAIKNQWCIENNIPLIRIPYTHLKQLTIEDLKIETTKFLINGGKMKMKTKVIQIDKVRDVAEFVAAANRAKGPVYARRGDKISVDAKSLMGMFSIDPSTPFDVVYDEGNQEFEDFIAQFEETYVFTCDA